MIYAYSDASIKGTSSAATSLLLTEDTFIDCFTETYENVSSSVEAELLGVLQTLEYICGNFSPKDKTILYTDSMSITVKCQNMLKDKSVIDTADFADAYRKIYDIISTHAITVKHIYGHQSSHNPNKVCDILSKLQFQR